MDAGQSTFSCVASSFCTMGDRSSGVFVLVVVVVVVVFVVVVVVAFDVATRTSEKIVPNQRTAPQRRWQRTQNMTGRRSDFNPVEMARVGGKRRRGC